MPGQRPAHSPLAPRAASPAERGMTLMELLIVLGISTVLVVSSLMLLGSAVRSRAREIPAEEAHLAGAGVFDGLDIAIADSASKTPFLDLKATFGTIAPASASKSGTTAPGTGQTFDTTEHTVSPVFMLGPPLRFGADHSITGPVTLHSRPVVENQTGQAFTVLRTDRDAPQMELAATFDRSASIIKLVAHRGASEAAIRKLVSGDVLHVAGRSSGGAPSRFLVRVMGPAREVAIVDEAGTVGVTSGTSAFLHFEVPCSATASTVFPWGLANPQVTGATSDVVEDAAVSKLAAPWTYYTADDGRLYRIEGSIAPAGQLRPGPGGGGGEATVEMLAPRVTGALVARAVLADGSEVTATDTAEIATLARRLRVEIGLVSPIGDGSDSAVQPVALTLELWNQTLGEAEVRVTVGQVVEQTDLEPPAAGFCYLDLNNLSSYPQTIQNLFKNVRTVSDLASLPPAVRAALWEGFDPASSRTWWVQCSALPGGSGGGGK